MEAIKEILPPGFDSPEMEAKLRARLEGFMQQHQLNAINYESFEWILGFLAHNGVQISEESVAHLKKELEGKKLLREVSSGELDRKRRFGILFRRKLAGAVRGLRRGPK